MFLGCPGKNLIEKDWFPPKLGSSGCQLEGWLFGVVRKWWYYLGNLVSKIHNFSFLRKCLCKLKRIGMRLFWVEFKCKIIILQLKINTIFLKNHNSQLLGCAFFFFFSVNNIMTENFFSLSSSSNNAQPSWVFSVTQRDSALLLFLLLNWHT